MTIEEYRSKLPYDAMGDYSFLREETKAEEKSQEVIRETK